MRQAVIRGGWALCPACGTRLCRVAPGARAQGVFLWCKRCKADVALETAPAGAGEGQRPAPGPCDTARRRARA